MNTERELNKPALTSSATHEPSDRRLHPAWLAFIRYCSELRHREIEILKIWNGPSVLAEVTRKKVKFVA